MDSDLAHRTARRLAIAGIAAAGWASSAGDARAFALGSSVGIELGSADGGFPPSLDLVVDPAIVELHVLRTLDAAFDGDLYVGANVYFDLANPTLAGPVTGAVQPGFSVDIGADPTAISVAGECRLGAQAADGAGFGVYVVPAIGLLAVDGEDLALYAGGTLQISVWFGL